MTESTPNAARSEPTAGAQLLPAIKRLDVFERHGRVAEALGTLIRVTGLRARIGETCYLQNRHSGHKLEAEVVGVSGQEILLTPLGSLHGVSTGTLVMGTGTVARVAVGEDLLGRVLDARGEPIDGRGPLPSSDSVPIYRKAPNAFERPLIDKILPTGVRCIDGLLTVGRGQRMGIFAMAGVGKSMLLGMLAQATEADVVVIVLVGERGRELKEFMAYSLNEETRDRTVIVCATSDRPALERVRAAHVGTAIAESFRDQGKNVLLLMDSVTRFARALRDIGLALGEPPTRKGFTPSVFSELPRLLERSGANHRGSITAFYTVLKEEEDNLDPLAEEVLSILDGHIVLSRELADKGHYPAIDVLKSRSRLANAICSAEHARMTAKCVAMLALYQDVEFLLKVGEYRKGTDDNTDRAIKRYPLISEFCRQSLGESSGFSETLAKLRELTA
ncbi:MAG: FliI/YscN family ATPase [Wenzhouxiangella sp.]